MHAEGIFIYRFWYGELPKVATAYDSWRARQLVTEHPEYEPMDMIGFVAIRNNGRNKQKVLDSLIRYYPNNVSYEVIWETKQALDCEVVYVSGDEIRESLVEKRDETDNTAGRGTIHAA